MPDDDLEDPNPTTDDLEDGADPVDDLENPNVGENTEATAPEDASTAPDPFEGTGDDEDWGEPNDTPEPPPEPPAPPATPPVAPAAPAAPQARAEAPKTCLVRIRHAPKGKVQKVKRYTVNHNGTRRRFRLDFGWYEVSIEFGRHLMNIRVNNRDPDSPRVFDVQNIKRAAEIEADELLAPKKSAEKPATNPRTADS